MRNTVILSTDIKISTVILMHAAIRLTMRLVNPALNLVFVTMNFVLSCLNLNYLLLLMYNCRLDNNFHALLNTLFNTSLFNILLLAGISYALHIVHFLSFCAYNVSLFSFHDKLKAGRNVRTT